MNILNNVQTQKWFTDFDLLMHEKKLLVKTKTREAGIQKYKSVD